MNELLNVVVANNKFLVAIETRLINIEAKIDAIKNENKLDADTPISLVSAPREYPQSAEENIIVAE